MFREIKSLLPAWRRGRPFEELVRWFLLSAPRYRGVFSDVWLWRDWPERWKEDEAGVDLVARTVEGDLWAIQAKAWEPSRSLPKGEIDTFLSESARPVFAHRLLVATTADLSRHGWDAVYGADKPVSVVLLNDLVSAEVQWPATLGDLRPAPPDPLDPLPHQIEAITAVVDSFVKDEVEAGQLVMACGSGKTLAALWIGERLKAERVLVLMPSLALVRQTLDAWKRSEATPRPFLTVCSDRTVVGDDGYTEHARDLGVHTTTDPELVAAFLAGESPRVVYATYQSSPQIAEAFARTDRLAPFDLVVADEAHQLAGLGGGGFATVLDRDKIPAHRRLFMTATPRTYTVSARKAAGDEGLTVASMDDPDVFGRELHRLGFREAIDRGILADYQVAVIVVESDEISNMVEQRRLVRLEGTGQESAADAEQLVGEIGLLRAMAKYDLRRVISFHSRKLRASRYADTLPQTAEWLPASERPTGRIICRHVNGTMTVQRRQQEMTPLEHPQADERVLVTNARCLSEGVDVPELDAVAFVDPRRSKIDIVQAVGRAIRRKRDRTRVGTIVVPLAIPANVDPDEALAASNFDRIRDVLLALRSHDERLSDELDELRRSLGRSRTRHVDLPDCIQVSGVFGRGFVEAISVRLIELGTDRWYEGIGAARAYRSSHPDLRVHFTFVTDDGFPLGTWIKTRRVYRRRGLLSPERISALDALDMIWDSNEDDWQRGLAAARAYRESHGDLRVPQSFVTEDGFTLGNWIESRRWQRRRGALSPEKIATLDAFGMIWNAHDDEWQSRLAVARAYRETHPDLRVPTGFVTEGGFQLGTWIANRRVERRRGLLSPERISALDALDMIWDSNEDDWQRGLAAARAYRETHPDLCVPTGFVTTDGFRLGTWVTDRRMQRKRGKLPEDRRAELDALDMIWEVISNRGVAAARAYRAEFGDLRVPSDYVTPDGYKLGAWISNIRQLRERFTPEQIVELDALGLVWDTPKRTTSSWQRGVAAARAYRAEFGDLRVPSDYVTPDGYKLGAWISGRRQRKKRQTPEQIVELDALGLVWDPRKVRGAASRGTASRSETAWQRGVAAASAFRAEFGDLRVPSTYVTPDDYRLGAWIAAQRTSRQRSEERLAPERIAELDALGMVWRGEASRRAGRFVTINMRVTAAEKAEWKRTAPRGNVSSWLRSLAKKELERAEHTQVVDGLDSLLARLARINAHAARGDRVVNINMRVTAAEKAEWKEAAAAEGNVSSWLRSLANKELQRTAGGIRGNP